MTSIVSLLVGGAEPATGGHSPTAEPYGPAPAGTDEQDLERYRENFARAALEARYLTGLPVAEQLVRKEMVRYLAANFDPRKYDAIENNIRTIAEYRRTGR